MLVLTRKTQEEIVVPQCELTITILEVRGDKVRIGITAPPELKVYRKEILVRMNGIGKVRTDGIPETAPVETAPVR